MIDSLIIQHGTDSQRERHAAGRLPNQELRDLARDVLFRPMNGFKRFRRLSEDDVRHGKNQLTSKPCGVHPPIFFSVIDHYAGPMEESEWETWNKIQESFVTIQRTQRDLVDEATLILRQHLVICGQCSARRSRLSVLVIVQAGELSLSREYAV